MSKSKVLTGTLEYRQLIILEDGTDVRVKYNQNPELYAGTDVPVYAYTATEGKGDDKKEVTKYAVPYEMAVRAARVSRKETLQSLLAMNLSAEDLKAEIEKLVA